jgi:hypothetical protein
VKASGGTVTSSLPRRGSGSGVIAPPALSRSAEPVEVGDPSDHYNEPSNYSHVPFSLGPGNIFDQHRYP